MSHVCNWQECPTCGRRYCATVQTLHPAEPEPAAGDEELAQQARSWESDWNRKGWTRSMRHRALRLIARLAQRHIEQPAQFPDRVLPPAPAVGSRWHVEFWEQVNAFAAATGTRRQNAVVAIETLLASIPTPPAPAAGDEELVRRIDGVLLNQNALAPVNRLREAIDVLEICRARLAQPPGEKEKA